ncbi:MAG: hypothetical protein Q9159_003411 [Coniocarpon cinnabarinum]
MPHKHKRKGKDSHHDLAPSSKHAAPLPVGRQSSQDTSKKRKRDATDDDDTPKAFRRLLQRQKHLAQGSKKQKALGDTQQAVNPGRKENGKNSIVAPSQESVTKSGSPPPGRSATEIPRILPHERLSDYGARIDASLPLSGLQKRGRQPIQVGKKILKQPQTRIEKKIQRMQDEWRAAAAKRKEREEAEADERELEELEKQEHRVTDELEGAFGGAAAGGRGGGKKKAKRREEDPWAVLEGRRRVQKALGDVVERPPDLKGLRGAKLKMKGH